ncbi:MAG: diaminopimelate decarboxylase [Bacteroides sp.]|nr:diaminopimelate decarboxylase [Bacteroides sp.]MCM1379462.1 diaminopimelate decarboxylase [Bacteroides sp.]MCM1445935.1 diaminopimelate decarboxylase [Prevotella sp.]
MIETPAYCYDMSQLHRTLDEVVHTARDFKVHYAVKANANPTILREIAQAGLGADCVSVGEVMAAVNAGIAPEKIAFAGVGKTDEEISQSLKVAIGSFNVESLPELEVINQIGEKLNTVANVCIRVNPNIDAHTHHYITTGLAENKFGINLEQLPEVIAAAKKLPNICLKGLHFHIGSQILDTAPFEALCRKINTLNSGDFKMLNVGGGLGIDYDHPDVMPDFASYFDCFRKHLNLLPGQELHFELGRSIVAQCGSLLTRVVYVKKGIKKSFVICDGGMNCLIRPALYGAHHEIENLTSVGPLETYDVVGPICESSDVFGNDVKLPDTKRGDILAIRSAGAYGESMASNYNLRDLKQPIFEYEK